ncbi:Modification methylase DpnIIA [subsurface metagenome]
MKFLRYPGGKGRLLQFLSNRIPAAAEITGRYIEPFIGGGAVFLHVQPQQAIISDLNGELVELYKGIRAYPHKVWEVFQSFPSGRRTYYKVRDEKYRDKPLYYRAARTLYLNRTCFKGMWRHSPEGNFSVGYGGEERRWVITHQYILELSKRFSTALILQADFEDVMSQCCNGDFVFLDPPYKPGGRELLEAHYTYGRFTFGDQARLARKLKEIGINNGVKWLMTNSAHPEICDLYADFNIGNIPKGTSGVIGVYTNDSKEVVISNY